MLRRTNKTPRHTIVIKRVSMLKFLKVSTIISQGFVNALEPAATKNAFRF